MMNEDIHPHPGDHDTGLDVTIRRPEHPSHALENGRDPPGGLFPSHLHHPHQHDISVNAASPETNHLPDADLVHQHLMTHNSLHSLSPHHQHHHHQQQQQQHQQYTQISHHQQRPEHHLPGINHHSPQQQEQHPFAFHHSTREEDNDSIVNPNPAMQHDVSVVDVGALHHHHHTELTSIPNHHHRDPQIGPTPLIHQQQEHQLALAMVYPAQRFDHQQFRQHTQEHEHAHPHPENQDRNLEQPLPSVDAPHIAMDMEAGVFPSRHSPIPLMEPEKPRINPMHSSTNKRKPPTKSTTSNKKSRAKHKSSKNSDMSEHEQHQGDGTNTGMLSRHEDMLFTEPKKSRRRRYDNDFKAEILGQIKQSHATIAEVAKKYSIPENTVREWTKSNVIQKIQTARAKNSGDLKANVHDPLRRLTEILVNFFENNRNQPEKTRESITTKLIVAKGLAAKNSLLRNHEINPFLDEKEVKALNIFGGSDSWAKKFARRQNLKMTGARIKELSEADVNKYHQSLRQISNRVKQAGPGYEEVAMLIRQAAEKLLCASIINSTASHYRPQHYNLSNKLGNDPQKQRNHGLLKLQLEEEVGYPILHQALEETTQISERHTLSPSQVPM